jgi:uncharacterized protein YjbI with pentapeptide repeats
VAASPPRLPPALSPFTIDGLDDAAEWHELAVDGDATAAVVRRLRADRCHLRGVAFTGAELTGPRFTDVLVEDGEWSGAVVHDATLTRVEFRRCRMTGLQLAGARLRDVAFVDCKLDEANLRMTNGERLDLRSCGLPGADFGAARLAALHGFDCDLRRTDFSGAEVTDARLHGSTLEGLRAADRLLHATIDPTQVMPFAVALFGALGVRVDEDRDGPARRQAKP